MRRRCGEDGGWTRHGLAGGGPPRSVMKCHVLSWSALRRPPSFVAPASPIRRPGFPRSSPRTAIRGLLRQGQRAGVEVPARCCAASGTTSGACCSSVLLVRSVLPAAGLPAERPWFARIARGLARTRRRTHFSREFQSDFSEAEAATLRTILAHFLPGQAFNETKSEYSSFLIRFPLLRRPGGRGPERVRA